jgi:FkbM family methyltransferase
MSAITDRPRYHGQRPLVERARAHVAHAFGHNLRVRGVDRALRAVYHPDKRIASHTETVARLDDGSLFAVDTRTFIEWTLYVYGDYEREIGAILRSCLGPGDVALDVGANIGVHTVRMARAVGPAGRVVAIEPMPELVERLRHNLELNCLADRVRIVAKGAGSHDGAARFYRPPLTNQGKGSFIAGPDLAPEGLELPVVTLDTLVEELRIGRVRLVKIDVEGLELDTIAGAASLIAAYRPYLLFEYSVPSRTDWNDFLRLLDVPGHYSLYEVARPPRPLTRRPAMTCMVLAKPEDD